MTSLSEFGTSKFSDAGLLSGSAGRQWESIAADLRTHAGGEIPAICGAQMEITLAIRGSNDVAVERRGDGSFQRTIARSGTVWLCPIGVEEDSIRITGRLPEILHLYIPASQLLLMQEQCSRNISHQNILYLADVEDELIRQIGYRILRELRHETAGGRLLVEQLSLGLVAHLVSTHAADRPVLSKDRRASTALDGRRLERVMQYLEGSPEQDLSIARLAEVACLSRFHFARAFRAATGMPPHRYVSGRRLERARQMLLDRSLSLTDIALACQFSSQASFTRAFQRQMGMAPGQYRRRL